MRGDSCAECLQVSKRVNSYDEPEIQHRAAVTYIVVQC